MLVVVVLVVLVQDGARWAGVQMGSLFSRPHATALFVVDGASQGLSHKLIRMQFFTISIFRDNWFSF